MKKVVSKLICTSTLCLLVFSLQAITVGYAGLVVYSDGTHQRPVGEDEESCQANLERMRSDYLESHADDEPPVTVLEHESLPCGPRTAELPVLDTAAWQILDIGPVCLSCPFLSENSFEIYYPNRIKDIEELYFNHKIDQYNKELIELQSKYPLEDFERAVFKLNQKAQHDKP